MRLRAFFEDSVVGANLRQGHPNLEAREVGHGDDPPHHLVGDHLALGNYLAEPLKNLIYVAQRKSYKQEG
jgi:hypothetical protein